MRSIRLTSVSAPAIDPTLPGPRRLFSALKVLRRSATLSSPPAPTIDPVPDGEPRPFWSVMIPVYNCGDYLRETLRSVLEQDPGPDQMQIEVIDNCSTADDPEAVVREVGQGRVRFHRQPRNVGAIENFNTCIRRSRGRWVHILHGDDTVRPALYVRARQGIETHPEASAVACRIINVDHEGHWIDLGPAEARRPGLLGEEFLARLFREQRFQFAGMIVRRAAYEKLGGFRPELVHCTDWDMWKRVAVAGPIYYDPEPLACFRQHAGADTSRLMRTGANVADERRSIQLSHSQVLQENLRRVRPEALKAAAIRAMRRSRYYWEKGDRSAALHQIHEAIRCSRSPAVLARLGYFFVRMVIR